MHGTVWNNGILVIDRLSKTVLFIEKYDYLDLLLCICLWLDITADMWYKSIFGIWGKTYNNHLHKLNNQYFEYAVSIVVILEYDIKNIWCYTKKKNASAVLKSACNKVFEDVMGWVNAD